MRYFYGERIPERDRQLPPMRPGEMKKVEPEAAPEAQEKPARPKPKGKAVIKRDSFGGMVRYESIAAALEATGLNRSTLRYRINSSYAKNGCTWEFE